MMPDTFPGLLIAFPAYNEEATIFSLLKPLVYAYDVLVVDDCSTDSTPNICNELPVLYLRHNINRGYSASINTAFEYALANGYSHLLLCDSDGQITTATLLAFIEHYALTKTDILIGSRHSFPRISEYIFSLFASLTIGISDPLCGLKIFPVSCFAQQVRTVSSKLINTYGANYLFYGVLFLELHVSSVPIDISCRISGPSRLGIGLRGEIRIFSGLLNLIFELIIIYIKKSCRRNNT